MNYKDLYDVVDMFEAMPTEEVNDAPWIDIPIHYNDGVYSGYCLATAFTDGSRRFILREYVNSILEYFKDRLYSIEFHTLHKDITVNLT